MSKETAAKIVDFALAEGDREQQPAEDPIADTENESDEEVKRIIQALLKPKQRKQADELIDIASAASLFHDRDGNCFADIEINGHRETWPLRARGLKRWLVQLYFEKTKTAPNSEAISTALAVIEARAHFNSPERTVHIRTAEHLGKYYLDLCNDNWQAVEIDAYGWRVVDRPPVRFRRTRGMQALPVPANGGSINMLRQFVNVASDEDFVLAVAWVLAALRSRGPYPVLVPVGEQGSGKSTITRIFRSLVDPNKALLRTQPRDERDLCITANNSWMIATDNVSSLPGWLSDAYCRLATGGGFATRELYTDQDETIFDSTRPIILNGIEDFVTKPDLADRAILLTLQPIPEEKRRSEDKLWSDFAGAHAPILGALLEMMAQGVRELPNVKLGTLPRMADFALWGAACETALWQPGTFIKAYTGNRDQAVASVIEADPVASALAMMIGAAPKWEGTAGELLAALAQATDARIAGAKDWPTTPRALSGRLRRAAPNLRKIGIEITFRRMPHTGTRTITIMADSKGGSPSPPSPPSPPLFSNDLRVTQRVTVAPTGPFASPEPSPSNHLETKENNGGDGGDGANRTQSGSHRCCQCNGAPDGTEQEHVITGKQVWLHDQCEYFWRAGDGWGRSP